MADGKTSSSHAPIPRVRTYAHDLDEQRALQKQVSPNSTPFPSATNPSIEANVISPKKVPLPPTNDHTSAPLPTATAKVNDLGAIVPGQTLSESLAEAVSATTKRQTVPEPARTTLEPASLPQAPAPISIPPFHELARSPVTAVQSKGTTPSTPASDFGATIITDTQSRRFKLFPSLFSSLARWWEARAKKRAAERAPKYVIPETDRRKGVIQRATSQTAKVATSDYEGLRQRLRERVEATVAAPDQPVTHDHEETIWTPHIEPIFPLLEAPQYTPSSVQRVTLTPKRRIGDTAPAVEDTRWEDAAQAYRSPTPTVPPPQPEPEPTPVFVPPEPVAAPVATTYEPPPTPIPAPAPVAEEESDEDTPLPAPARPAPSTNPKRRPAATPERHQFFLHTNTITVCIVGVVVLGSLTVYTVPRLLKTDSAPAENIPTVTQSTVVAAPVVTRSLSLPSRDNIMTALNLPEEERTLPAVEIVLSGGIAPATLLETVDPNLPQSLVQNVSKISFGWYERSEPFIIMTIIDRTSVWGSLLQNEGRLPKTLSPLFSASSTGQFIDRVVGGHDVRTLTDSSKQEVITYGLIDDHTLIVTTDTAAFLSVETLVTAIQ